MLFQHRLNGRPVARGRGDDAAGAKHGFTDEGCDGVCPFAVNERLQFGHAMGGEGLLRHVQIGAVVVIGRLGMDHLRQRQVEFLVEQLQPRQ